MKSGQYAYIGRRQKKRDFRRLWITRISAAAKINGMNYSTFMNGMKKAGITLNRKMLAELAVSDAAAFAGLAEKGQGRPQISSNCARRPASGRLPCPIRSNLRRFMGVSAGFSPETTRREAAVWPGTIRIS